MDDGRTPSVGFCSVPISSSRGPASTEPIASTAFRIKFRTLLQLNAIPLNRSQLFCEAGLNQNSILDDRASCQHDHFIDRLVEIKTMLPRRRFPDVITDPVDNVSGAIGIAHDTDERFPDLAEVRRLLA
jgi:hypothetical protein